MIGMATRFARRVFLRAGRAIVKTTVFASGASMAMICATRFVFTSAGFGAFALAIFALAAAVEPDFASASGTVSKNAPALYPFAAKSWSNVYLTSAEVRSL